MLAVFLLAAGCSLDLNTPPPGEFVDRETPNAENGSTGGTSGREQARTDPPAHSTDELQPAACRLNTSPSVEGGGGGAGGAGGASHAGESGWGSGDLTVLVIFDKSGSMGVPWEDRSRWESANDAFLKGLEGVESEVTLGAIVFPQPGQCEVASFLGEHQIPFQVGTTFIERWKETVMSEPPEGGTPLGLAFERANHAIDEADACGLLEGRFRVLIVTDGEPNCGTNENALIGYAQSWRARGVETQVMGLPGSEQARVLLDRIAGVGGSDEHVATGTVREAEDHFWHAVR